MDSLDFFISSFLNSIVGALAMMLDLVIFFPNKFLGFSRILGKLTCRRVWPLLSLFTNIFSTEKEQPPLRGRFVVVV